jgi:hypothetical protein
MTPLEDKLRAAIHATAAEIPADPPPLRLGSPGLSPRRRTAFRPGRAALRPGRLRGSSWLAPLTAAALVVAVVAVSLAVTGRPGRTLAKPAPAQTRATSVPPYYVALTTRESDPQEYEYYATTAVVRATATGAVLARIAVPKPYAGFTGVTAAANDRTFVLVAAVKSKGLLAYVPGDRLFLLRIDPARGTSRASLQALPADFVPANEGVDSLALSPDGAFLAVNVGGALGTDKLYVFNLATGTKRAWSAKTCSQCLPSAGGLGFGGVNVDELSWTADGQHLAFPWGNTVRLLATGATGTNLLANSKQVAVLAGASGYVNWRGVIITPDGRTVVAVEELSGPGRDAPLHEKLQTFSAATGKVIATLNDVNILPDPHFSNYEQILYSDATGHLLVIDFFRPGDSAGILRGDTYTPIPWSPYTVTAAW